MDYPSEAIFADQYPSGTYKLFELNENVIRDIKENQGCCIKGNGSEVTVLSTYTESYTLLHGDTSNLLLLGVKRSDEEMVIFNESSSIIELSKFIADPHPVLACIPNVCDVNSLQNHVFPEDVEKVCMLSLKQINNILASNPLIFTFKDGSVASFSQFQLLYLCQCCMSIIVRNLESPLSFTVQQLLDANDFASVNSDFLTHALQLLVESSTSSEMESSGEVDCWKKLSLDRSRVTKFLAKAVFYSESQSGFVSAQIFACDISSTMTRKEDSKKGSHPSNRVVKEKNRTNNDDHLTEQSNEDEQDDGMLVEDHEDVSVGTSERMVGSKNCVYSKWISASDLSDRMSVLLPACFDYEENEIREFCIPNVRMEVDGWLFIEKQDLSSDPRVRFEQLFDLHQQWTHESLVEFIKDLSEMGHPSPGNMMVSYCRDVLDKSVDPPQRYYVLKR